MSLGHFHLPGHSPLVEKKSAEEIPTGHPGSSSSHRAKATGGCSDKPVGSARADECTSKCDGVRQASTVVGGLRLSRRPDPQKQQARTETKMHSQTHANTHKFLPSNWCLLRQLCLVHRTQIQKQTNHRDRLMVHYQIMGSLKKLMD